MSRKISVTLPPCYPKDHPDGPAQLVQSAIGDDTDVKIIYGANVKKVQFQFSGGTLSPAEKRDLVNYFTVNDKKPIFLT